MHDCEVVKLLKGYKDNQARLLLLDIELNELSNAGWNESIEASILAAHTYDTGPGGGSRIYSKVEHVALNRIGDMSTQKRQLKSDLRHLQNQILKVEILLSRLCNEDRFIIEQKYFAQKPNNTWRVIARDHAIKFDKPYGLNWKSIKWRVNKRIIPFMASLMGKTLR